MRAQKFRKCRETKELLRLFDEGGEEVYSEGHRQLSKKHQEVVIAEIYSRANRITNRKRIDMTRRKYRDVTLWENIDGPNLKDGQRMDRLFFQQDELWQGIVMEWEECNSILQEELLRVHGSALGTKVEGICQIRNGNANGIDCRNMNHPRRQI